MELFLLAVILLLVLAVIDLVVGVSNDAANFLNSSLGSKVAPRYVIMIIASLGILVGVTFSSGMMEVARKGIFHPQFFTMPELMIIFLAVMLTDVILLDLFNTYGLPTSTTVSIVFELLGAAVAASVLKVWKSGEGLAAAAQYINSNKAMIIIFGILFSVAVAFICGAIVQFFTRLLFTFDYARRMTRFGGLWGGAALASIVYFILVKGAKGASFITPESVAWIASHTLVILSGCFVISAIVLQVLRLMGVNILKPIVLIGTFALAMAFAANDLMNFIGVPMAGLYAHKVAQASGEPLTMTMGALGAKVQSQTSLLLLAGLIMVVTLWISRKARTVTSTELGLGQQLEGEERFEASPVSRVVVRITLGVINTLRYCVPPAVRRWSAERFDASRYIVETDATKRPSFDLLRASVNLMVASAVISYATAQKLPLSTTYVTFMVSMGTSFADRAWGRESAVYRVTGVLMVIGGWFMTAIMAFTISGIFALVMFSGGVYGGAALLAFGAVLIYRNHHRHGARVKSKEEDEVFNLEKVQDVSESISITFEHMSRLLREIRTSLDYTMKSLFAQNTIALRSEVKRGKKIQRWSNIITANIFKSLRFLQKEDAHISYKYGQTIRRLQKLTDGRRDVVMRAYNHVSNQHKGLLDIQIEELTDVTQRLREILEEVEQTFAKKRPSNGSLVIEKYEALRQLAKKLHQDQLERIRDDTSKTRLSILFYAIVGNAMMLSKQVVKLLEIFEESFDAEGKASAFDME